MQKPLLKRAAKRVYFFVAKPSEKWYINDVRNPNAEDTKMKSKKTRKKSRSSSSYDVFFWNDVIHGVGWLALGFVLLYSEIM